MDERPVAVVSLRTVGRILPVRPRIDCETPLSGTAELRGEECHMTGMRRISARARALQAESIPGAIHVRRR
jgi:hypothetical protein